MIEIPPRFANAAPLGPSSSDQNSSELLTTWKQNQGLAEDIRRYGSLMLDKARAKIGHLFPKVHLSTETIRGRADLARFKGQDLPVIAYLWARTVKSPNPAFSHACVPLVSSFVLSNNEGKEAYVVPDLKGDSYSFRVEVGPCPTSAADGTKLSGANFKCLLSGAPISAEYIRLEAQAGRMGQRLLAIVADAPGRRIYLSPDSNLEKIALSVTPTWSPSLAFFPKALGFRIGNYGMKTWSDIFTKRQIVALSTLTELVSEVISIAKADATRAGLTDDHIGVNSGGVGASAYAEAIGIYLAFAVDRCADFSNTCVRWVPGNQKVMNLFGKQTVSMTWDFPEASIFEETVGGFLPAVKYIADCVETLPPGVLPGRASQESAIVGTTCANKIVSTDPPYYDNIGYADLSDFFYIWLQRSLSGVFPDLFLQAETPKHDELVATPGRHGGKESAEAFFLRGMTEALKAIANQSHPAFPVSIYYAFKQSETNADQETSSTGWETFLDAVIKAGFAVSGTWPIRSEQSSRIRGMNSNALASSVVLICKKRPASAKSISRRDFMRELNAVLPDALEQITLGGAHSPVAPVDLSQAIIGPGMEIFTKYSAVLEADGKPMSVKTALQLINRFFAEDDFDHDTQFCINWFEGHSWDQGKFGDAEVLARAKGTSVDGLRAGGVIESSAGNLRIIRATELPTDWSPESDARISVWEILHHMIRSLNSDGEAGAGEILSKNARYSENVRTLAYRLYTLCERRGLAQDAGQYNSLILSWDAIEASARSTGYAGAQVSLFGEEQSARTPSDEPKKRTRNKR
ncbi:MAG: DUF1156 domain-containing protein [Proteobacteria bacterium]|nr:MAG: DUF1156 domain-containing protein [Pseudomonadota bacterium]